MVVCSSPLPGNLGAAMSPPPFLMEVFVEKKYREPLEPTPLEEYIDEHGHEVPNPVPVAPPVGFVRGPSMVDHIRSMVRSELLRREVEAAGVENFEEADDFEIEDDPVDPSTPYEAVFDPVPPPAEPARAPSGGAPAAVPAVPVPAPAAAPPEPAGASSAAPSYRGEDSYATSSAFDR